eukprot:4450587-Amphidinium_carterae.1
MPVICTRQWQLPRTHTHAQKRKNKHGERELSFRSSPRTSPMWLNIHHAKQLIFFHIDFGNLPKYAKYETGCNVAPCNFRPGERSRLTCLAASS